MNEVIKNIFSITNEDTHKVIRLLGIKLKQKRIKNVYVGCGDDSKDGYIGCDIRKRKNVKIVCKAWDVSKKVRKLENIYSRHMVEHLTFPELEFTLSDWYKALNEGGKLNIIVPYLDFHIQQFQKAIVDDENWNNKWSDFRWSIAGFYGWQGEDYKSCKNCKNSTRYWDVHKSGYNPKIMEFFLKRAGFIEINCEIIDDVHLFVTAKKPYTKNYSLTSGERQIAETLEGIRADHLNRYNLAIDFLKRSAYEKLQNGADIFCGNGYGSYMLSNAFSTLKLLSIDGSEDAIKLAKDFYQTGKIEFKQKFFPFKLKKKFFDFIISLESIEHIQNDELFLKTLINGLKRNGFLIISTPNSIKQDLIKNPNPFHCRHYTNTEIVKIFKQNNLEVIEMYGQDVYKFDKDGINIGLMEESEMGLKKDYEGQFSIFILVKNK